MVPTAWNVPLLGILEVQHNFVSFLLQHYESSPKPRACQATALLCKACVFMGIGFWYVGLLIPIIPKPVL